MCGIAGYSGKNINPDALEKALKTISHRGPDDYGVETFPDSGLGHQRLSILDLSDAGHQPMFSKEKDIALVFNGEIYNFLEIKKELSSKYDFRSDTDSEVLIYAYKEWGKDCLQRFNGMFSFVLYDREKDLLFGARDRLGEKPLKYYYSGERFFFASEVKAIISFLKSLGTPVLPDPIAIDNYLTFGYVPAPKTGFKDIYKLPPAHYFIFKNGELETQQYWSIDYTQKLDLSLKQWKEEIISKLEKAVKMRLMSDVPLGAFLSGGIDSSAVVAFLAKNSTEKVKTFSMGFDDPEYDETEYAKIVAEKYDTDHNVFRVTAEDLVENLDSVFSSYDEPFADDSNLPTYLLAKKTKEHVTVVLNGDGGDENFAGYDRYGVVAFSELYKKAPKALRQSLLKNGASFFHSLVENKFSQRAKTYFENFEKPFPRRYVNYNSIFSEGTKKGLYSKEFSESVRNNDSFGLYEPFFNPEIDLLDNALFMDIQTYLPEDLLYKTDIASMAFGLEFRAPFLDHTFMEFTAKMPSKYKISNFDKKHVLKEALVERDILPREVVYRPKQGFSVPLDTWFKEDLKDYVYENLMDSLLVSSGIFDTEQLQTYLDKYYSSSLNYGKNIYSLICLNQWFRRYFN